MIMLTNYGVQFQAVQLYLYRTTSNKKSRYQFLCDAIHILYGALEPILWHASKFYRVISITYFCSFFKTTKFESGLSVNPHEN